MKKSIITIAAAAVFTVGFNSANANVKDQWFFGKNDTATKGIEASEFGAKQTYEKSEITSIEGSLSGVMIQLKKSKAPKVTLNYIERLLICDDAFRVDLKMSKISSEALTKLTKAHQELIANSTAYQALAPHKQTLTLVQARATAVYNDMSDKNNQYAVEFKRMIDNLAVVVTVLGNVPALSTTPIYTAPVAAPAPAAAAPAARGR